MTWRVISAWPSALAEREGRLIDSWQTIRGDAAQLGLIGAGGSTSGVGGVASVDTPFSAQVGTGTSKAEVAAAAAVGPGGHCSPRHPTRFEPSSLELNGAL